MSKSPDFEQKNKTYYNTTLDRECHTTYSEPTECNDGAIQSPLTYRIPVFNQEHCDRTPEQKTLKSRLQEVKDFGMLIDVLNFVPLEAVKAAAEDLPPEYANVKRLVKFAVWDDAQQKWVALPRYAHPGYTKPLRWIDAIAGINHISVPERVDREVKAAPW
ncbi:hypothetical protein [Nostoc piscinale]|uniref:hypothetical protein n=1 Tax=Nostoc piscinale TaxID=224012 RepID=UPI00118752F6|nr:hypothetical protein [Nostoc piscinale]